MWITQLRVLTKISYAIIALIVAWTLFTFSLWLPNIQLIALVLSGTAPFIEKITFLLSLYASIDTNFTPVSATYTIVIAILLGVNISLLVYYIRRVRGTMSSIKVTGISSIGGIVSGFFGIGCAACGTFILTSALTLFGVGGVVAFLPFGGEEFGFIGVGLLLYSIYTLLKKINTPKVCIP